MSRPLVDYLIARQGLPAPSGLAYDYVTAGDGVFVVAESAYLRVRLPVARGRIRGLPPIYSSVVLKHGRIPGALWEEAVALARRFAEAGREVLLAVVHEPLLGYRLRRPLQVVGGARVLYRPTPATVLELHSHHRLPAFFSATDDADEQGFRLYGVLGRLDAERPEVALRVGCYGHMFPLAWEEVFTGERSGFRDLHVEPREPEDNDELPD